MHVKTHNSHFVPFESGNFPLAYFLHSASLSTPLTRARQSSGMWEQRGFFSLPSSFQRNLHGGERQSPLGLHGSAEGGHYLQYWLTSGAQCWCFMIGEHTRVAFGGTKLVFVTEVKKKNSSKAKKEKKCVIGCASSILPLHVWGQRQVRDRKIKWTLDFSQHITERIFYHHGCETWEYLEVFQNKCSDGEK